MPYTRQSAVSKATVIKAQLAAAKLRLFKNDFVPNVNSLLADFVAAECDFAGYAATGITIAAFNGPIFNPNGGADLISPLVLFAWATAGADLTNMVGGWFLTTAAATAPLSAVALWSFQRFPTPVGMAQAGDAIPLVISFTEGQNPTA